MNEITAIIKSLPEGKRKRACIVVASKMAAHEDSDLFWESVRAGAYGAAADYLLKLWPNASADQRRAIARSPSSG
jgi:hypothetical protein